MMYTLIAVIIAIALLWKPVIRHLIVNIAVELSKELTKYDSIILLVARFMGMSFVKVDVKAKVKWIEIRSTGKPDVFIPLPFNRNTKCKDIFLIYDDDDEPRNLSYPHGVPFYCTASQIGCSVIRVTCKDGSVREFRGDEKVEL